MPANPLYHKEKGDLVLLFSDDLESRVRSVKLRGASDVFDSMLTAGANAEQVKAKEGLPNVKLGDKGDAVGLFLLYAINPIAAPDELTFETGDQSVSSVSVGPQLMLIK